MARHGDGKVHDQDVQCPEVGGDDGDDSGLV